MGIEDPEVKVLLSYNNQLKTMLSQFLLMDKNKDGREEDHHRARQCRFVQLSAALPASDNALDKRSLLSSASAVYIKHDSPTADATRSATSEAVTVYNCSTTVGYASGDIGYVEIIGGIPCFLQPGGRGGGASIMGFTITDADCEAGTVYTELASIDRYTGCGEPPGLNEYTGEIEIEDYLAIMGDLTDVQLIGKKALAVYWNNYPACVPHWDLLLVDWTGGC